MRILMISRDPLGLDPASQTSSRWKLLRDQGIDLMVLVLSSQKKEWSEQGICVKGVGGSTVFHRLWNVFRVGKMIVKPDLVTVQDVAEMGFIGWRLSKFHNVPCELQDHGGYFDGGVIDEPLWFFRGRLAEWLVRRVQLIRTVSTGSLNGLKGRALKADLYWLPIEPSQRFLSAEYIPEDGVIVTVCRLVPVKRVDLLLKSFAELKKKKGDTRLIIVGDGPLRRGLERASASLGIERSVEFVGSADPLPYLKRAKTFALLSAHEGWGVAAVEAALIGVPVVMTNTGCANWLRARVDASLVETDRPEFIADILDGSLNKASKKLVHPFSPIESARVQVGEWKKYLSQA